MESNSSIQRLVYLDDSQNGFVLRANRSILKMNPEGKELFRYDFDIPVFETGMYNDLQFYAFNGSFQRFFVLDKYLNPITSIDFSEHFPNTVDHPVLDANQSIWLFNRNENKLQRWTTRFSLLTETPNLDLIIPNVSVDQIVIHKNEVYAVDFSSGIYGFDFTGQLVSQYLLTDIEREVQISQGQLCFFKSGKWYSLDLTDSTAVPRLIWEPDQYNTDLSKGGIFVNHFFYYWNDRISEVKKIDFHNQK